MYMRLAALVAFLGALSIAALGLLVLLAYAEITQPMSAPMSATLYILAAMAASIVLYLWTMGNLLLLRRQIAVDIPKSISLVLVLMPVCLIAYIVLLGPRAPAGLALVVSYGALVVFYLVYAIVMILAGRCCLRLKGKAAAALRKFGGFLCLGGIFLCLHSLLALLGWSTGQSDSFSTPAFVAMVIGGFFLMLAEFAIAIVFWRAAREGQNKSFA